MKGIFKPVLAIVFTLSVTLFVFQNCSDVSFNSKDGNAKAAGDNLNEETGQYPDGVELGDNKGLIGGHFDLDTATAVYDLSDGQTNHHVHEYDNKYDVTEADFFNMKEKLDNVQETISADQSFIVIVANANLSPGAMLEINGQLISVLEYQNKVNQFVNGNTGALSRFVVSGSGGALLSSLKIVFDKDVILKGGLIPTQTGCVVNNDPGALGEYRNGALIVQAIDANNFALGNTGVATENHSLLWEATLFWHQGKDCYGK